MKKTKQIRNNRISILFSLLAIILFPFISNAQLTVVSTGYVGIGNSTSTPTASLDVASYTVTPISGSASLLLRNGDDYLGDRGQTQIRFGYAGGNTYQSYIRTRHNAVGAVNNAIDFYTGDGTANGVFPTNAKFGLSINNGKIGIGSTYATTNPVYNLQLDADLAGKPTSSTWTIPSDKKTKTNIQSYRHGLDLVRQVKLISYEYNGLANTPKGEKGLGVIAQDFQNIFPNSVKPFTVDTTTNGNFLGVNFHELFIANVAAVQQLDSIVSTNNILLKTKIDSLKTKTNKQDSINTSLQNQMNQVVKNNTSLQNQVNQLMTNDSSLQNQLNQLMTTINKCCNISQPPTDTNPQAKSLSEGATTQMDITLNNIQTIVLQQNVPNPFAEQTTINYFLPDNTLIAQMLFYDAQGQLIQTIALTQKGKGALNVFAQDLTTGIYTYTLVVDGKIIETKKMMKQ
jgi:hypothetical protein